MFNIKPKKKNNMINTKMCHLYSNVSFQMYENIEKQLKGWGPLEKRNAERFHEVAFALFKLELIIVFKNKNREGLIIQASENVCATED